MNEKGGSLPSFFSRENALRLFWAYASRYDTGNGKIRLKIDHMLRVADLCATFARQIGLAERDEDQAWLIGLLHDIGRFEQVKKYDTFLDGKSENHALLGVKEIKKERLAERMAMTDACNETICTAIACHNMLALPAMDERKLLFAKLLRDADKVDIFYVRIHDPLEDVLPGKREEIEAGVVSKEVMDCFARHVQVPSNVRKSTLDLWVSVLAFVFDINYAPAFRHVKEQRLLPRMIQRIAIVNEEGARQARLIEEEVCGYVERRINGE